MDHRLFLRYNKFADSYKMGQPNIYYFLKDCGFQRIYKSNGNRFPNPESQNMCNSFQMEMQQANWQRQNMSRDEYKRFLEDFFKKMDFNSMDLETCELLKLITENIGIFGPFDDLTNKRIIYFNKKIDALKKSQPIQPVKGNSALNPSPINTNPSPQNTNNTSTQGGNAGSLGLPDAGKGDVKAKDANKERQAAEDARLNEIMRQQKLNSPIYITNGEPGKFYNPYTNPQYIPNGIDRSIPLPMNKRDPNYPKLKAIIEEELLMANQELDYHKVDMARNHLEKAAYYLKNVID
jgi:uncharacterized protein YihD (DUF1040 family)